MNKIVEYGVKPSNGSTFPVLGLQHAEYVVRVINADSTRVTAKVMWRVVTNWSEVTDDAARK